MGVIPPEYRTQFSRESVDRSKESMDRSQEGFRDPIREGKESYKQQDARIQISGLVEQWSKEQVCACLLCTMDSHTLLQCTGED